MSIAWREARDVGEDECAIVDACSGVIALALEYRRSQDDLRFRAEHDTLTGLANRATLLDTLDAVAGASPGASALLIDLGADLPPGVVAGVHHAPMLAYF